MSMVAKEFVAANTRDHGPMFVAEARPNGAAGSQNDDASHCSNSVIARVLACVSTSHIPNLSRFLCRGVTTNYLGSRCSAEPVAALSLLKFLRRSSTNI
jgi:hypothetical protein